MHITLNSVKGSKTFSSKFEAAKWVWQNQPSSVWVVMPDNTDTVELEWEEDEDEDVEIENILDEIKAILRMRRVAADRDWFDGDRGAPKTPWGLAQDAWEIARGVTWYSTAGHGGLKVAAGVARAMLTDAARKLGLNWGGSYWYEEDVAWARPSIDTVC